VTEMIESVPEQIDRQQLAAQLVEQARAEGVDLVGPDGLLTGLTKTVLETALEAELSDHLGYDKHDRAGRNGGNSRNGIRTKRSSRRSARCRSTCLATGTGRSNR
jgi:putative transposase